MPMRQTRQNSSPRMLAQPLRRAGCTAVTSMTRERPNSGFGRSWAEFMMFSVVFSSMALSIHAHARYVRYLQDQKSENGDLAHLPEHMSKFLRFVVKSLLEHETFDALKHFAPHLATVQAMSSQLLPPLGEVLVNIAKYDLLSKQEVDVKSLNLAQRQKLFTSQFYASFQRARVEADFAHVKQSHELSNADRGLVETAVFPMFGG